MIKLSRAEAIAMGIKPPREPASPDGMNGLERRFVEEILRPGAAGHHISGFLREPIKLRLAGRTWYTPDFLARLGPGPGAFFIAYEVKGFMRDDAAVKIKVAATLYPCIQFVLVRRDRRRGWLFYPVSAFKGIAPDPVPISWLQGG